MPVHLEGIFDAVLAPADDTPDHPVYAVVRIRGYESYLLGKDREGHACLLAAPRDRPGRPNPPIRLEKLDVQFELKCRLKRDKEPERDEVYTVIRCRALDRVTTRYFLSICGTILGIVGDHPASIDLSAAIQRLAAIFQKIQCPPARTLNGLFGELYVIHRSASPAAALAAWRVDEAAIFDFSAGNLRLDVKTASGRVRAHNFSYDQCNPPLGTFALAASLFIERVPIGLSLRALLEQIEGSVSAFPDLVLKLHEVIAATLGVNLGDALGVAFDSRIAESSLRFYNLTEVPGIRSMLPVGVSDVHFRSDLSACQPLTSERLALGDLGFEGFLPRTAE